MRSYAELAEFIRQNEVGRRAQINTPYGPRLMCYADLTATGRYLHFVESWIRRVRSFYANTHTAVSTSGRIMTQLREEARRVVERSVNAGEDDVVLFVGAGATSAVNKLVGLLGIRLPEPLEREYALSEQIPPEKRPVVLVGPYEHHSNELPWMESIADVVEIGLTEGGHVDMGQLEARLEEYADRPLKIGTFSAASNVNGILTDVKAIARMLHRHGAYAVFDYAACGPYVPIDMHPGAADECIDALFMSVHKFIGGPQASGVLVANREMFRTRTPERPGGGTVAYVSGFDKDSVDYLTRPEEREEGGTPAIMGDVRAGTAFLVKEMIGADRILDHEVKLAEEALERLSKHPRIRILGPTNTPRLSIISLVVEGLHHDLVSVLLDQLFGIQNRAGCSCAGPYGHRLLGIGRETSEKFRALIGRGVEGIKPGWVRVTLPFYASREDVDFILSAVEFVADHGMDFVPLYRLGWSNGVWRHTESPAEDVSPLELTVEALQEAAQNFAAGDFEAPIREQEIRRERARYFEEAHRIANDLHARWKSAPPQWNVPTGHEALDELVWFRYVHTDDADAVLGKRELAAAGGGR